MSLDRDVRPPAYPEFDPDDHSSNPSDNRSFQDVLAARISRRGVMRGGTVVAAAGFLGALGGVLSRAEAPATVPGSRGLRPQIGFAAVPTSAADAFIVPAGYTAEILIPWGTPIH